MNEQLVRDLAIEEYLQIEIKATLEHNNKSYVKWRGISEEKKLKTR